MATVFDVVRYILEQSEPMSAVKLQKLAYYSQAWHLAWDGVPLFEDRVEAWANGPVVRRLWDAHKGTFQVTTDTFEDGDSSNLESEETSTIDAVLNYYGDKTPHWLSLLTHQEAPWKDARRGLEPGERGSHEITKQSMQDYYAGLL